MLALRRSRSVRTSRGGSSELWRFIAPIIRMFERNLDKPLAMGEGRAVHRLRTGSLESLRERNRLRVIDALRTRGAISRADIARQTGLSRSTVSSLVGDLQTAGLVVERVAESAAPASPQGGRPPVLVALDQSAGAVIGLDFGHDSLRVAVADLSYAILAESFAELEVDTAAVDALDAAAALVS